MKAILLLLMVLTGSTQVQPVTPPQPTKVLAAGAIKDFVNGQPVRLSPPTKFQIRFYC
ncbi:MAG: hypothetical protein WCO60_07020 [Verrucomicrobiota bacterium]